MLGFESPNLQQSLEETAAWCALKSMRTPLVDAAIMARRRVAEQELSQLFNKARAKVKSSWFKQELTKTKEWREAFSFGQRIREFLSPLRYGFRTPELKPDFDFDTSQTNKAWKNAVAQTVAKRSAQLRGNSQPVDACDFHSGRLLLFVPEENLACGGAEFSSHGFFDVNNVPPWDLWVAFSEQTLVSWVPPELVEIAQLGIDANPEACVRWAD